MQAGPQRLSCLAGGGQQHLSRSACRNYGKPSPCMAKILRPPHPSVFFHPECMSSSSLALQPDHQRRLLQAGNSAPEVPGLPQRNASVPLVGSAPEPMESQPNSDFKNTDDSSTAAFNLANMLDEEPPATPSQCVP